jgi:hypothetical protein
MDLNDARTHEAIAAGKTPSVLMTRGSSKRFIYTRSD